MGHIGYEIVFECFDAAELFNHLVKILEHYVHIILLIRSMEWFQIDRKIAFRYLFCGLAEFSHGLIKGFVLLPCGEKAEDEGNDDPISRDPEDVLRWNVFYGKIGIVDQRLPCGQRGQHNKGPEKLFP